jgi:hypothetical protein
LDAPSLEQRIADALCSDMSSAEVEALIGEVEASVAAAEARALDPTVLHPSARIAAADAEFTRDRLRTALPKLRTRLAKLQRAEAYASVAVTQGHSPSGCHQPQPSGRFSSGVRPARRWLFL